MAIRLFQGHIVHFQEGILGCMHCVFLKVKIEGNFTCKNLPHNQLKFGLCLSSSKMLTPCNVEEISKVYDLLVTKQSYILGLKEQINGMQKNLVQKEGEQKCAHLIVDIRLAMHTEAKTKVDKVKAKLKEVENALSLSISMGGDHLQALPCSKLMID